MNADSRPEPEGGASHGIHLQKVPTLSNSNDKEVCKCLAHNILVIIQTGRLVKLSQALVAGQVTSWPGPPCWSTLPEGVCRFVYPSWWGHSLHRAEQSL